MLDIEILQWLQGRRRHLNAGFAPCVLDVKGPFRWFKRRSRTLYVGFRPPECWCYWDPDDKYFPVSEFRLAIRHLKSDASPAERRAYAQNRKHMIMYLPYLWDQAITLGVPHRAHN